MDEDREAHRVRHVLSLRRGQRPVAVHEAGHIVAAYLLGVPFTGATLWTEERRPGDWNTSGRAHYASRWDEHLDDDDSLHARQMIAMAGRVVADRYDDFTGDWLTTDDDRTVLGIEHARGRFGFDERELLQARYAEVKTLLDDPHHWRAIEAVADALVATLVAAPIEQGSIRLEAAELVQIIERAMADEPKPDSDA